MAFNVVSGKSSSCKKKKGKIVKKWTIINSGKLNLGWRTDEDGKVISKRETMRGFDMKNDLKTRTERNSSIARNTHTCTRHFVTISRLKKGFKLINKCFNVAHKNDKIKESVVGVLIFQRGYFVRENRSGRRRKVVEENLKF